MYNLLDKFNDWAFDKYISSDSDTFGEIWWRFISDTAEFLRDKFPAG